MEVVKTAQAMNNVRSDENLRAAASGKDGATKTDRLLAGVHSCMPHSGQSNGSLCSPGHGLHFPTITCYRRLNSNPSRTIDALAALGTCSSSGLNIQAETPSHLDRQSGAADSRAQGASVLSQSLRDNLLLQSGELYSTVLGPLSFLSYFDTGSVLHGFDSLLSLVAIFFAFFLKFFFLCSGSSPFISSLSLQPSSKSSPHRWLCVRAYFLSANCSVEFISCEISRFIFSLLRLLSITPWRLESAGFRCTPSTTRTVRPLSS